MNKRKLEKTATSGARPPRDKKDSWKVKEIKDTIRAKSATGSVADTVQENVKSIAVKYRLRPPPYREYDFYAVPRRPTFSPLQDSPLCVLMDRPVNKRGYKYIACKAAPDFMAIMYRTVDIPPFCARLDFQDVDSNILMGRRGDYCSTDKGYRMARANVGVRSGDWYCEYKIARSNIHGSHCRIGWARREAALDAPVGFDAYSYGIRDVNGEAVFCSRPKPFMKTGFGSGDVIGFHIHLPELTTIDTLASARERIPIRYRNQLYFEQWEYTPSKEMEELVYPTQKIRDVAPAKLQGSYIDVYKNGECMGRAHEDLFDYRPPWSRWVQTSPSVDDGSLGYYPAISVYKGAVVKLNCGPNFEFPMKAGVRPISERFEEQIVEDIVWDLVDEVEIGEELQRSESLRRFELQNSAIKDIEAQGVEQVHDIPLDNPAIGLTQLPQIEDSNVGYNNSIPAETSHAAQSLAEPKDPLNVEQNMQQEKSVVDQDRHMENSNVAAHDKEMNSTKLDNSKDVHVQLDNMEMENATS